MLPDLTRRLRVMALICLFTSFAGVIYQLIREMRLDYNSVVVGFPLGLVCGLFELFLLPKVKLWFRNWSFTKVFILKTLFYTVVIYIVTVSLVIISGLIEGRKWSELPAFLTSREQLILVIYALVIYGLLVFFIQINHLLGEGILWKFIRGKYHQPHEEERIFMFLDMKSSTAIAEQLGHVRFYRLLNELFHEISQPVIQTKAEIYQYIGDEVVLTWKLKDGLENSNCLRAFFLFQKNLVCNRESYFKKFGVNPEFKAGLHFGKVISAQIGDIKREIVYNGDVLNTTSRIQEECNIYQRNCLVSGILMNRLQQMNGFHWEKVDVVKLRGKEIEIELFSVSNAPEKRPLNSGLSK